VVVHHVEVNPVRTGGNHIGNLFTQFGEVGGKNAGAMKYMAGLRNENEILT